MRYMAVTFALCLLVVSAYAGTYVENFDDGDFDGWEVIDGGIPAKWTVENGVAVCRRDVNWGTLLQFGEDNWRNYTIECDAKIVEPLADLHGLGLNLRTIMKDDGSFDQIWCVFSGANEVGFIWPWLDGAELEQKPAVGFEFQFDRWYRIKAVAHEDTFEFYIDGRLVASLTDDRFPSGQVSIRANSCEAHFDNIIITGDDVPDNTDSLVDGDIMAIVAWHGRAWNARNLELFLSIYTDDFVFESPPYPPVDRENQIPNLEWFWATYPTHHVDEGLSLASAANSIGFMEHSDLYVHPDNGVPIDTPHICVMDFRGLKSYKHTVYGDWQAAELIQAGLMPPHNLGDMIPSFPLPHSEAIGLSPMEASTELTARLNSGDLSSVAKMIREDANIRFPFIDRQANRSEFIDIYEQIMGGFSDVNWENVRRLDMGNGWLFSEATLKGTNDGELLGKQATGLPMEIKAGLIEHYDENGLADYVHFHFDSLSMPGQEARMGPVEDFSNVFFVDLTPGLNMVSLPLKPQVPYTARSLAEEIGATVVIKYDEALRRFVGFTSGSPGDGFPIEGGKGYIVNCLEGKTHTFTGAAWTNEPSAEAAPPAGSSPSGWAFIVSVAMTDHEGDEYTMTVRNLRTGAVAIDSIADGRFHAVFADLDRNTVIEAGGKMEIVIRDSSSKIVAGPVTYQIGQEDIRKAFRDMVIPYGYARPEKSVLLQNYPNPFNPETWIPFHLAQDTDVSVRIYDASGKLIRSLALGHKEAGIYVEKDKAVYWDGRSDAGEEIASGIYFYTINAGGFSATRKMIVKR